MSVFLASVFLRSNTIHYFKNSSISLTEVFNTVLYVSEPVPKTALIPSNHSKNRKLQHFRSSYSILYFEKLPKCPYGHFQKIITKMSEKLERKVLITLCTKPLNKVADTFIFNSAGTVQP